MEVHCYLVTYDISCPKRWRKIYDAMHVFGEHVQLSVFRCDLTGPRLVRMKTALDELIDHGEDQVIVARLGRSTAQTLDGIEVLGRPHEFLPPGPTVI